MIVFYTMWYTIGFFTQCVKTAPREGGGFRTGVDLCVCEVHFGVECFVAAAVLRVAVLLAGA